MTGFNQDGARFEVMGADGTLTASQEESILEKYRADRRESGVAEADKAWLQSPLSAWSQALEQAGESECGGPGQQAEAPTSDRCMSLAQMAVLAVLIGETLPIRDGLIASLICGKGNLDCPRLLDLCVHPHEADNVTLLCDILDSAFKDGDSRPDLPRCRAGLALLDRMAGIMRRGHKAQSHAVAAYTLWWMGGDGAASKAEEALADDAQCSLAAIVLNLTVHSILPAWKEFG